LVAALLIALAVVAAPGRAAASAHPSIEAGDRAWARRADGAEGDRAAPGPIAEAIAAYEAVLATEPESLEALWKLQRALHFQGEFTRLGSSKRARIWERGTELAERAIAILHRGDATWYERPPAAAAAKIADRPVGAAVHFWAAVHWGLWGETKGALRAVRKGIAKRIRDHALVAIELDETYDNGGPHRLLGRLHAVAPRVPLLTGWVSRDEALRHLERAVAIAPDHFGSRLYLAEARLELQPDQREQALAALEELIAATPAPESLVENRRAQDDARAVLARSRSTSD
jgi:tetratricopeptide (TPR) repeat protein